MKTTKKIIAALLVVMMLAMMIPFSASAAAPAGPYTATYVCAPNTSDEADKVGDYTFSFYKVATLNTTTGEYTVSVDDAALKSAVNTGDNAGIIAASDALYAANPSVFGDAATTISFTSTDTSKTASVNDAGIYYIYCTSKPSKVTAVTNSVIALPYYNDDAWVTNSNQSSFNLASKVSTSPVNVTKTADKTNIGDNDKTVTYTLTASTAGSTTNKLTTYAIVDTMDAGLTLNEDTVTVTLGSTALNKGTDYAIQTNYSYNDGTEKTATFAVVFTEAILNSDTFYNADPKTVTVTYEASINDNAKMATAMPNSDGLVYGNDSGVSYEPGQTVNVFTYGIKVKKVDGNNTATLLKDAVFTVYTDSSATTPLTVDGKNVTATTGNNGEAVFVLDGTTTEFKFDKDATYYVKETKAPVGYALNDTVFTVSIGTDAYTWVNGAAGVSDYKVTVPQTGGMGTMMFTIGGAALIACAGVLFLIVRRKKSAE